MYALWLMSFVIQFKTTTTNMTWWTNTLIQTITTNKSDIWTSNRKKGKKELPKKIRRREKKWNRRRFMGTYRKYWTLHMGMWMSACERLCTHIHMAMYLFCSISVPAYAMWFILRWDNNPIWSLNLNFQHSDFFWHSLFLSLSAHWFGWVSIYFNKNSTKETFKCFCISQTKRRFSLRNGFRS